MAEPATPRIRSHLIECPACGAPNPTNTSICWHCEKPTGFQRAPAAAASSAQEVEPAETPVGHAPPEEAVRRPGPFGLRGMTILALAALAGIVAVASLFRQGVPILADGSATVDDRNRAPPSELQTTTPPSMSREPVQPAAPVATESPPAAPASGASPSSAAGPVPDAPAVSAAPAAGSAAPAPEPRPTMTAVEAQRAFGWPDPGTDAAAPAPRAPATPAGCPATATALGFCADAGPEEEKRP